MNEYLARLKAKIQEKPIPQELTKLTKGGFDGFVSDQGRHVFGIDKLTEPDPVEIEERKGMAPGSVPERYLDARARFQLQCPGGVTEQVCAKPSTMQAGSSPNGASLPIALAGLPAICSMCRAMVPWALFGGSRAGL